MIIERLDLLAFGRFNNRSLDLSAGPHRFHIIYGPNESGKSTSLRAISDWLFGFKGTPIDDYVVKMNQLRVGGRLVSASRSIDCIRRKGNKDTLLQLDNKTKADTKAFDEILGELDRETFEQQFGISHHQLVEGGRLILEGKGDLGEILFSAGAGLSRLQRVRDNLKEQRAKIYTDRRSGGPTMYQSLNQWDELRASLREVSVPPAAYLKCRADLDEACANEQAITQKLKATSIKRDRQVAINRAAQLFINRRSICQALEKVKDAVVLAPSFGKNHRDLCTRKIQAELRSEELKQDIAEIRTKIDALAVDPVWLQHEDAIERLNQTLGSFESAAVTITAKRAMRTQIHARTEALALQLQRGAHELDFDESGLSLSARSEIMTLANQYSGVVERLSKADEELHRRQELLRKYSEAKDRDAYPLSPEVVENALRAVGNPTQLLAARSRAEEAMQEAAKQLNDSFARLTGFEGTLEEAIALRLPPTPLLSQAANDIEQFQADVRAANIACEQVERQFTEAQRRAAAQKQQQSLPDPARLEAVRQERDQHLNALIDAASEGQPFSVKAAIELRDTIREIDATHHQLHEHHDLVLRRRQEERELHDLQILRETRAAELQSANESLEQSLQHWRSLWLSIGVNAGDVSEMRSWHTFHLQLLDLAKSLQERTTALRAAEEAIDQATETLRQSLRVSRGTIQAQPQIAGAAYEFTLFDSIVDDDLAEHGLPTLHALALREREELAQKHQAHELLTAQFQKASDDLEEAQRAHQWALKKRDDWDDRWKSAIEPLKALGGVAPESIDTMMRAVDELTQLKQAASATASELESLELSQQRFTASVQEVAAQCLPEAQERDISKLANQLVSKLKQTVRDEQKRVALADQLEKLTSDAASVAREQASVEREFAVLCAEAHCDSPEALADCETASTRHQELKAELTAIEDQLRLLAGGQSLEQFEQEASAFELGSIESEINATKLEIQRIEAEQATAFQAIGVLKARVNEMDGSERAAEILQRQQNLLAKIRREAEQYAKLTVAQDVLAKAIEHYRSQNEGAVLSRASDCFSRMTEGLYSMLKVDFNSDDEPVLYAIRSDGETQVPANRLSDGTADALYLSLRIASLEVHLKGHRHLPLIVDDCLIQFDDGRATAALKILSELSTKTQVIMFTHHQHIVDLAEASLAAGEFHLHELQSA